VDFRVLGADGSPITDLKAEELKVAVDGRDRVVQSLRLVQVREAASGAPALPPPFATNLPPEGQRTFMVLFNDASIRAGQEADVKSAISRFVGTLGRDDMVGLLTMPRGAVRVEPTTDRAAFAAGLEKVVGQAAPMESSDDFRCRTGEVVTELRGMFDTLRTQTTPTYMLFFSAGLATPTAGAARLQASSACELRVDLFQNLSLAAAAGRVQMYVMQPEGLTTPQPGDEGLENLAGVTGSRRYRIGSSGQSVLDQIAAETSAYYLATVGVEDLPAGGQPHRLDLTVSRPDSRTIAHNQFVMSAADAGGGAGSGPSPQEMLRTEGAFRDLPLRVGAYSSRNAQDAKKPMVIAMLEPLESVTLTAAAAGLVNAQGRLVAQWTARPEELARPLIPAALAAEPGSYRLRMSAVDSTGRRGAADYRIDVGLHQVDTVQVSDLWTFSTKSGSFMPVMEYSGDDTAMPYFELYGQPPPGFYARLELARTMEGEPVASPQLQAAPGDQTNTFFRITGQIPLAALEPGDYVLRATLGTSPRVNLYRTLRKVQ
jgi:hypothetical protein